MIERIYIPSVRRHEFQITYNNLPSALVEKVVMVVEPQERHLYERYSPECEFLELPEAIVGSWTQLARTRHLIHKHAGAIKYAVIDDDVIFRRRNAKYWTGKSNMARSKRDAEPHEIIEMFNTFDRWLDEPDIGVVGPSNSDAPPPATEYADTKGVFASLFVDGAMLNKVIDNMDITAIRVAEDVLFMYECLANGINTRLSTEWTIANKSVNTQALKKTRVIWQGMYPPHRQPVDHFQTDEHYKALAYIQNKYPDAMKIYEKDGRRKNTKYWKKAYRPSV